MAQSTRFRAAVLAILALVVAGLFAVGLFAGLAPAKGLELRVNPEYRLLNLGTILSRRECNAIINCARPRLERSHVQGASGDAEVSDVRTSETAWVTRENADDEAFLVVEKLRGIMKRATGVSDDASFEELQVVRYRPGQKYGAHFDSSVALGPPSSTLRRHATLIAYLNDNFKGGETFFPKLNKRVVPAVGKGLLFFNLDENSEEHAMSLHESLPVTSGTKYACQLWMREIPL